MLPPAPVPSNVIVGATIVKRFPGYGERRGTITEIDLDGGEVVVGPDPARDATATTSKFWGVSWAKNEGRWLARYRDASGKKRHIGYFDTQEEAAHAVNAAIRRAGLVRKRRTNPVVDGQLVPRERKTAKKRRRDESGAATPPSDAVLALRAELERLKRRNRKLKMRRR